MNVKNSFEKGFSSALALRVAGYGYVKRKGTEIYRRTNLGKCGVRVGYRKTLFGFDISLYLFVRVDEIERLAHMFPPNKYWKDTPTLDTEIGRFITGETKEWSIALPEDRPIGEVFLGVLGKVGVPRAGVKTDSAVVLNEMVEAFESFGLPFLEKYCDCLESILSVISQDTKEALELTHSVDLCARKAIVAAYLLNERSVFDEIADRKESLLERVQPVSLEDFKKLRNHLAELFAR